MRRRRRSSRYLAGFLALSAIAAGTYTLQRLNNHKTPAHPLAAMEEPNTDDTPRRPTPELPPAPQTPPARPLFDGKPLIGSTQTPDANNRPAAPAPASPVIRAPVVQPDPATRPAPKAVAATPTTLPSNLTGNALADGQMLFESGRMMQARGVLNNALQSGQLSEADAGSARHIMADINQSVIFSRRHFADDPNQTTYTVLFGDKLQKVASANDITWEFLCRINGISDPKKVRAGQTLKIIKGPFHALVTKSKFTLDIYLGPPGENGSVYITTYPVGLGKDDSTPAGAWMVEPQKKLKRPTYYSPRGEGIIAAGDPKNPLGEYWLGLAGVNGQAVGKLSYGIHGTNEPNSIGKMESMGCIRMRNDDVAIVYEMLLDGKSTVVVKD